MDFSDDWNDQLELRGYARIPDFISGEECAEIEAYWEDASLFRREISRGAACQLTDGRRHSSPL